MTVYIGVDFHPHTQTFAWCDTETGETDIVRIDKNTDAVRALLERFGEPAEVGIEATGGTKWFEKMVAQAGHRLMVGNSVSISKSAPSKHRNDARDARHILELMLDGKFPAIWRRSSESNQVIEVIVFRHKLVGQRTECYNRLQALAHSIGMQKGAVRTAAFQAVIKAAEFDPADSMRRDHLFRLVAQLNVQIDELSVWLKQKAVEAGKPVELLQTQKGVGYLTALVTFHTLGDVSRFNGRISRQVVNFAGLDPCDDSSGTQIRFGSITKAGSWLLRYQLGQAAVTAIRYDPRLKAFYKRLLKKKQKNVAKTAASRKLLVKLAIMLRDDITAQEFDRRGSTVGNARDGNSLK